MAYGREGILPSGWLRHLPVHRAVGSGRLQQRSGIGTTGVAGNLHLDTGGAGGELEDIAEARGGVEMRKVMVEFKDGELREYSASTLSYEYEGWVNLLDKKDRVIAAIPTTEIKSISVG